MRTFDLWVSFKFFDREEDGNLVVAVFTDILISRHGDLLIFKALCF